MIKLVQRLYTYAALQYASFIFNCDTRYNIISLNGYIRLQCQTHDLCICIWITDLLIWIYEYVTEYIIVRAIIGYNISDIHRRLNGSSTAVSTVSDNQSFRYVPADSRPAYTEFQLIESANL